MGKWYRDMRRLADSKASFEHGKSLVDITLAEGEMTNTMICPDEVEGIIDGFGNPHRFFAHGHPLGKGALPATHEQFRERLRVLTAEANRRWADIRRLERNDIGAISMRMQKFRIDAARHHGADAAPDHPPAAAAALAGHATAGAGRQRRAFAGGFSKAVAATAAGQSDVRDAPRT